MSNSPTTISAFASRRMGYGSRCSRQLRGALLVTLGLYLASSGSALAEEGESHILAEARSSFTEGVEAAQAGEWERAIEAFQHSNQLRPSATTTFNLASALVQAARLSEAVTMLDDLLAEGEVESRVAQEARELRDSIEPRISRLTITLTGSMEDVMVFLDDVGLPIERVGVLFVVDPGPHSLIVRRSEEIVASLDFSVAQGERTEINLDVPDQVAPIETSFDEEDVEEDEEPTRRRDGRWLARQWWFWTVVGAVVVGGAATGIALGVDGSPDIIEGTFDPSYIEIGY